MLFSLFKLGSDPHNSNVFRLLKPLKGCKEDAPQPLIYTFSMLVQTSMPDKVARSGAFLMYSILTPGPMPSKLLSQLTSASNSSLSTLNLLSPAKPWSDVAAQA
jgi:hypothetical protein